MNGQPVPVVMIGCLECGNQSDLIGIYPDVEAARAAHPEAEVRSEIDSVHPWMSRQAVLVIFDRADPAAADGYRP